MLLTDAFGGFGGIAKFNRDFLNALAASEQVKAVWALPRLIPESIHERLPENILYDCEAAKGKIWFAYRLAVHAFAFHAGIDLVVCGHLNLLQMSWALARLRRAHLALIIHGVEAWKPRGAKSPKAIVRNVDSALSVSKLSAERFCSWSGLPASRIVNLPNSVDLERFVPQPRDRTLMDRYGLHGKKVIMTMGRLESKERAKGFDEVLEALPQLARRFPQLGYLIVGDGPDRGRLEAKAKVAGVSELVVFTGRIKESEKVAHYSLADVFAMPSSGEGFGIVLIEAAGCGIPVVGSRCDGSREALLDGKLGPIVDPADRCELVRAITAALEDPSPRVRSPDIATFSVPAFHHKVDSWLRERVQPLALPRAVICENSENARFVS